MPSTSKTAHRAMGTPLVRIALPQGAAIHTGFWGYPAAMPSSVARLVGLDHERMIRLLKRACSQGPNQQRWRDEFTVLLRAHRVAEREELLAEVGRVLPELGPDASRQNQADRDLDRLAEEVANADVSAAEFSDLCNRTREAVTAHGEALRSAVVEPLARATGRKEMRILGGRYARRRDEELRDSDGQEPPPRRLDVSRAELYELAKKAGIEGRSGMSRDQLITELQRRQND